MVRKAIFMSLLVLSIRAEAQKKKSLTELVDPYNLKWEMVSRWVEQSKTKVTVLPRVKSMADSAILQCQISTDNVLGAIIYNTGGILIDNGWIRILGSGCKEMDRSLPQWNKGKSKINTGDSPNFVLVADDVIGGLFAINTGGIDELGLNKIFYFGPNSLKWQPIGLTYEQFVVFCMTNDLREFYSDFKWKGWENEISQLGPNQVVSAYPLLWTKDGKELKKNRKVTPIQKLWDTYASKHKELTISTKRSLSMAK